MMVRWVWTNLRCMCVFRDDFFIVLLCKKEAIMLHVKDE